MKKVAKAVLFASCIIAATGLFSWKQSSGGESGDSLVYLTEKAPEHVGSFAIEGANVIY